MQQSLSVFRPFKSVNPCTDKVVGEFNFDSRQEIAVKINKGYQAFEVYKNTSFDERSRRYLKYAEVIESHIHKIATTITSEMGKPYKQSEGEVKRTANHFRFYAANSHQFNNTHQVKTEATNSYTICQPLGLIHIIIPFNFPFWLAFKACASYMLIGNAVIVRGSDSTPSTTLLMKEMMTLAGFGDEFQVVFSKQDDLEFIVSNPQIRGVSFTGSSIAGSTVASVSGKYLKKCVMELGGSDPFIVLEDANVDFAVEIAVKSRLSNGGQVCNSSKRFLIHEQVYKEFKEKLIKTLQNTVIGDPIKSTTELGPLARKDLLINLQRQIKEAVDEGSADIIYGNRGVFDLPEEFKNGYFIEPIVMEVRDLNSVVMKEETFGPLFALYQIKNAQQAMKIANESEYGLGGVIMSKDLTNAEKLARDLDCGMAFVNQVSMSDTRCSSGGVKRSGYGRECGEWGCQEFANIKTVWIEEHK